MSRTETKRIYLFLRDNSAPPASRPINEIKLAIFCNIVRSTNVPSWKTPTSPTDQNKNISIAIRTTVTFSSAKKIAGSIR